MFIIPFFDALVELNGSTFFSSHLTVIGVNSMMFFTTRATCAKFEFVKFVEIVAGLL